MSGAAVALLRALLDDVVTARAVHREQLARGGTHAVAQAAARQDCLRALEAYADALERRHWPVPRRVQQDIRLHRALSERRPS